LGGHRPSFPEPSDGHGRKVEEEAHAPEVVSFNGATTGKKKKKERRGRGAETVFKIDQRGRRRAQGQDHWEGTPQRRERGGGSRELNKTEEGRNTQ